ncbi:MAG: efflux RND transporter periplasmic adaptor subunit [Deltaproteobacteria bacterium]|nr:efflux RND transporter periplasmic adaptor subunit [Deltaproteobacteria bacterium]
MYSRFETIWHFIRAHPKRIGIPVALVFVFALSRVASSFWRDSPYQFAPLERGDLQVVITATGTLEPEEVIDVGAQIAGQISSFGTDANGKVIDYRSEVEAGMVLAKIDDVQYSAQLLQAQAQLKRANADVLQMQAKLDQAERDWKRAQKLGPSDALSSSSYDAYRAGAEIARANVAVAEAEVTQAQAQVTSAERNLSYCTIVSPVKGVVIDRRVNIGQTVVASLNAPSLFLIAKDLNRMQVWVSVNEADIGKIHPGQKVTFTVDAFPNEEFSGEVLKIRLNATMSQNVVTYIVEVATDNSNGKLLPYITANVSFHVTSHEGVWLVPNAALRWNPPSPQTDKAAGKRDASQSSGKPKRIWVKDGNSIRPIPVSIGDTDGVKTEIEAEGLSEDMQVVVGMQDPTQSGGSKSDSVNPFAPTVPRGGRRGM